MPPQEPDMRPPGAVHDCSLPQWAVDKMTRRRGRRYAHETIDPVKTALVIIDLMRNAIRDTPCAASIVAPCARLAQHVRRTGGVVAWVYPQPITADAPGSKAIWGDRHLQKNVEETAEDSPDRLPADGLVQDTRDLIVRKSSPSAFFPGRCDLPDRLAGRGIDTVLITGVLTNICCESSARDAATLGYKVIMVADANAARSDEEHRSALYNILRNFGDVRMSNDLIALLGGASERRT